MPLEQAGEQLSPEERKEELASTSFPEPSDEELLKAIRDDYKADLEYWRENREEAAIDSRYYAGDPWEPDARAEREGANRPVMTPDELSQYVNEACNNLRQNELAAKVSPKGAGANDEDAERRAAIIRGIEQECSASQVYETAFEQMVTTGFLGAWRLNTEYISDETDEQMPVLRRIPNGATVLPDPLAKKADFSDMKRCFVLDVMRQSDFLRDYPKATVRSFDSDALKIASDWIKGDEIIVGEAWRVLYGATKKVGSREVREFRVMQYITNGLEILERRRWLGSRIPIIIDVGREVYKNDKSGRSTRLYLSLIRKARSAAMMCCFMASQEAEEYGMSPRAPFMGYTGQFETNEKEFQSVNKQPLGFLQVDVPDTWQPGWGPPPLPIRPQFQPNAQAYELGYERWRRNTQASVGSSPLPTQAQRQNEKSGIALEKIQTQQAVGNFHFISNHKRALENSAWQLNEMIDWVIDTPRHVPARYEDGTHGSIFVCSALEHVPEGTEEYLITGKGKYGVTIGTGPNFQSQREEASSFVDVLIQNIKGIPVPPPIAQKLLGLAIKLKNLGPIGDEIAKMLIPPEDDQNQIPPQAQQAIMQAQGMVQQLQGELQKLMQEREGKVIENEYRLKIAALNKSADVLMTKLKIEAGVAEAEISTNAQDQSERGEFVSDVAQKLMDQAHELTIQANDHVHEQGLAQQAAQNAQMQQATQIAADQTQQNQASSTE